MYDYRLFFPGSTLDGPDRGRRPAVTHDGKRVNRLPAERPDARPAKRR